MTTAVAAAKTDSSPVLILSGEIPVDMEGLGEFQDASQATLDDTAVMKPLTRLSTTVASATQSQPLAAPRPHRHAGAAERTGASVPDPRCAASADCAAEYVPVSDFFAGVEPLSQPAAEHALNLLAPARRALRSWPAPASSTIHAAAALKAAAERWSIPVATTLRAKGVFPEDHELSLGVFGYAGTRHATAALLDPDLDVLLILGSGLNERDTMHWTLRQKSKAQMIHVNTDMDEIDLARRSRPCGAGQLPCLPGAARQRAGAPAAALVAKREPTRQSWIAKVKAGPRLYDIENCQRPTKPIHPAAAIAALRAVFPRDGIVLVDSGAHRAFAGHYWSAYEPRTYISATNLGPMGWAIPAAVGRAMRAARAPRRRDHRRRLHAHARHGGADRRALSPADHLCRAQQRRARQCLAARASTRAPCRRN